jgi:hypothetical protein
MKDSPNEYEGALVCKLDNEWKTMYSCAANASTINYGECSWHLTDVRKRTTPLRRQTLVLLRVGTQPPASSAGESLSFYGFPWDISFRILAIILETSVKFGLLVGRKPDGPRIDRDAVPNILD